MLSNITPIIAIVGSLVGLYGAVLSSFNAYWLWRDRHSHIRIILYPGTASDGTDTLITWLAQNIGTKTVTLAIGGFMLPGKSLYLFGLSGDSTSLPHNIEPGNNLIIRAHVKTLVNFCQQIGLSGNIMITGFVASAIGQRFSGGKLELDIASGQLKEVKNKRLWTLISERINSKRA